MSLRGADVGGPHSRERAIARILAVAMLAVSLLAFVVPDGSALPHNAAQVSASHCQGKARRLRPGQVSFSFSCGESQDVTAFVVQANRTLHSVSDPSFAFGCQRSGSRSFDCEDIHSGAGPEGSGIASVTEPLCHRDAHLALRITPTLNFDTQSGRAFTLKGPC